MKYDKIKNLVEKFSHNIEEFKNPKYNEAQIRVEFVNPFFEELGWDVSNKAGYAISFRDVIHEDEVKVGSTTKAPDYSFRIGGKRIFFVETKKPSIDLRHNPAPAFQLRRYAYSSGLPISILTDFEEFIVYDCRLKPTITDKPAIGRMLYFTYQEYIEKWDQIQSIFSKEAVMRGDLERWIGEIKGKRPREELNQDFLADLDCWRLILARNIALRNPSLNQRELNWAVQLTIDRLIFLRMCEDRGIESPYTLQAIQNGTQCYKRLVEIYYRADERYNSGLFHFNEKDGSSPDTLTPELKIDDKVLKELISELYYPKCAYEFSILPVEILGHAYEQFLGKVIRLTEGHQAKVEEKPEVRKAGGIYYTPQYIVDYIVNNTVGKLLEGKKPAQVSDLHILDPACGSGSFLLGAFQHLMDWHLKQYVAEFEKTGKIPAVSANKSQRNRKSDPPAIFQGMGEQWFLSTAEKKRILINNIYGVDIDANAVEVTKLSLLLKVLEHESGETIHSQLKMWHERALPNLVDNIKCGNSLIGSDYYENQQTVLFNEEEVQRINAFDWEKEFPEIFKKGGFDVVIGNPPYVRQEMLSNLKNYFQYKYEVYHGVADLFTYFIQRGISLLKEKGLFSYIVANKWMRANYGKPLRKYLKSRCIEELIDFGDLPVFKGITTYPCIIRVKQAIPSKSFKAAQPDTLDFQDLSKYISTKRYEVTQEKLDDEGWSLASNEEQRLLEKLKSKGIPLGEYVKGKIYRGVLTGLNEAFVISKEKRDELISKDLKSTELIKPFLEGKDIKRYEPLITSKFLIMIPKGWTNQKSNNTKNPWAWFSTEFPAIASHLESYKHEAEKRWDKGDYWWELRACDYYDEFEKEKIIYPNICKKPEFTFDASKFYTNQKCFIISIPDKYLLGILNSKLIFYLFHKMLPKLQGDFYEPSYVIFKNFPFVTINQKEKEDRKKYDEVVSNVNLMIDLHEKYAHIKDSITKEEIQRRIYSTDKQIDKLVYDIYDLVKEEIQVIENSF